MGEPLQDTSGDGGLLKIIQEAKSMTDDGDESSKVVNGRLYGELGGIAKQLSEVMQTMNSLGDPLQETAQELPGAADQLADIRRLTEEGTHRVLGFTEDVMEHRDEMAEHVMALEEEINTNFPTHHKMVERIGKVHLLLNQDKKILMDLLGSLEFQDLAAQRLKKTATALQELQSKILQLMVVFGITLNGETMTNNKKEVLSEFQTASSNNETLDQSLVDNILKEFGF